MLPEQQVTGPRCLTLEAGPTKRLWVNKHHLPQFGGKSPTSPVWFVEEEFVGDGKVVRVRRQGFQVCIVGPSVAHFDPTVGPDGPHAWIETTAEVWVYQAVEEAA